MSRRPKDRSHWGDMAVGLAAPRPNPAAAREKLAREAAWAYFKNNSELARVLWSAEHEASLAAAFLAFAESVEKMR